MTFSDTVAQQREKQVKALRRFVGVSLAGSVVLHSGGLFLRISDLWKSDEPVSEEITIVVTEEDETEPAIAPDALLSEPTAASEFSPSTVEPFNEPTVVDEFIAPLSPVSPAPKEPIAEELPTEEPVAEEVVPEETEATEDSSDEVPETTANAEPPSRNLSDLLEALQQARQQASQTASLGQFNQVGNTGIPAPNSSTASGSGSTTAVAPTRLRVEPETVSPPANRGSRSREITCRNCDFDYPESANGAEGRAQVIVETDAHGRVVSVMLSRSSGNAELDRAALEQVRKRVQLNNARAGESYPLDIDFVRPNSDAARRVRERGDRRSITVSDPDPLIETPAPTAATSPSPTPEPTASVESTPTQKPSASAEPSSTPALEPRPSSTTNSEPPESTQPVPEPRVAEPIEEPDVPAAPPPSPEPSNSQAPSPASSPDPLPPEP